MKLREIASRIKVHLNRLEADDEWNRYTWTDQDGVKRTQRRLYNANAGYRGGSRIAVIYVSYQGVSNLSRAEALAYLEWLDNGNKGTHFLQQRGSGGES